MLAESYDAHIIVMKAALNTPLNHKKATLRNPLLVRVVLEFKN